MEPGLCVEAMERLREVSLQGFGGLSGVGISRGLGAGACVCLSVGGADLLVSLPVGFLAVARAVDGRFSAGAVLQGSIFGFVLLAAPAIACLGGI